MGRCVHLLIFYYWFNVQFYKFKKYIFYLLLGECHQVFQWHQNEAILHLVIISFPKLRSYVSKTYIARASLPRQFLFSITLKFQAILGLRWLWRTFQEARSPYNCRCADIVLADYRYQTIGHAGGNENIYFDVLFMLRNGVIGHLIRHFSMENYYKLSQTNLQFIYQNSKLLS